ncbi:hypothetical protein HL658_05930 [Azospirillum sp. RWY-5-1]|uniref:Uncharacterized protein n=1 Tax=Azospirillum oleiclasticum TaxID=2735135 RepID=A0ABX2T4M0_9PROT|nr:hypothetical protein [Azospirillum oleiclasticum]NYZ12081.1 hypothetical protein [Azospirillum oleiclasticum]NYZ19241.1 hypothetical protein [Azospirillum oleiclasticum]
MTIDTLADLERAVAEFQRLQNAPHGSADERRRRELDAQIKAFAVQHPGDMSPGKPDGSIA